MCVRGLAILSLVAGLAAPVFATEPPKRDLTVEQTSALNCCAQHPGSLVVEARLDRPDATYGIGDTVRLWVQSNESAYITIFDVGPTGTVTQLFPNQYQTDGHVMPGQPVEIAGPATGTRITVAGPVGAELIKIVASNKPIAIAPESALLRHGQFRELEGGVKALVRDLQVVAGSDQQTGEELRIALKNVPVYTGAVVAPPAALFALPEQQPFQLTLAVDKPSYGVGESVTMAVTSLAPCYLTLLDATTSGTVRLLFPNQAMQNNHVDGGQTVLIGRGPTAFVATPPAGIEKIIAVCSTNPAPVLGRPLDYSQLFPLAGDRAAVSRDLAVVAANPAGAAFATTSFTILP